MTRILRNTFSAAFMVSAAIMLAGCPSGTGAVIPGATGAGGTGNTPTTGASTAPTADACQTNAPSGATAPGKDTWGKYKGLTLPGTADWTALKDEAAVTASIRTQLAGSNAACFRKFYKEAVAAYERP